MFDKSAVYKPLELVFVWNDTLHIAMSKTHNFSSGEGLWS